MPDTMPLAEPTVATEVLVLLHVPPVELLLSVVAAPVQTNGVPEIAAGDGLTLTSPVT